MNIKGIVRKKWVGGHSKSGREALVLETDKADFILRIRDHNAMELDTDLLPFLDKKVRIDGAESDRLLFVDHIAEDV